MSKDQALNSVNEVVKLPIQILTILALPWNISLSSPSRNTTFCGRTDEQGVLRELNIILYKTRNKPDAILQPD